MKNKIAFFMTAALLLCLFSGCGDKTQRMLDNAQAGDIISFGSYEQDNDAGNGKEPIEWRVMSRQEDRLLLLSDKALDCIPYHEELISVSWEDCSLRAWLANDFMETAFNEKEKEKILETVNKNPGNSDYLIPDQADTLDKVFLLNTHEIDAYFGTEIGVTSINPDIVVWPTEYAKAKGAELRRDGACMWYYRGNSVPATVEKYKAPAVDDLGKHFNAGRSVTSTSVGIRPAIWVKITSK